MKNTLFRLLLLLLCLCMLASCATGGVEEDDGDPTVTTTDGEGDPALPPQVDELTLVEDGASDYFIVYSLAAPKWEREAARTLQEKIEECTGVRILFKDDAEYSDDPTTQRTSREIVVGSSTNRNDSYTDPQNYQKGYSIQTSGERLVILAGSETGMYFAMEQLVEDLFGVSIDEAPAQTTDTLRLDGSYAKSRSITSETLPYLGVEIEDFVILYESGNAMQKRMAHKLRDRFETEGLELGIEERIGNETADACMMLVQDDSIENGDWRISVDGTTVTLAAGDYNGFNSAVKTVKGLRKNGFYPFADGYVKNGNFKSTLGTNEASSAYAYDRQGDTRIMFYNVLWSSLGVEARHMLRAEMIGEYMPDVLGLQEFNLAMRGGAAETGKEGDGGLVSYLSALGYVEAIDARVKNSVQEHIDYWGDSNRGYEVTVGGETYYTFYNNTPLFYNAATTECLDVGYYMYVNQYDEENNKESSNPMGGVSSCASKSLTWGVFRDRTTGKTYAVISTHMCTRSNGVRGKQAEEVIALIDSKLSQYDCPVFLGGDMNGNLGDANYDKFVSDEVGYTSLQDSGIATTHTSDIQSYLGEPKLDLDSGLIVQGNTTVKTISQTTNKNSIDQIFLTDTTKAVVGVMGVVVDDCTLAGSDHLPVFADFTVK